MHMGKNTKIICTVVPNATRTKELRQEPGKDKYSAFSVFLTPRLPDSGILKDYYEIVNWFKFLSVFTDNEYLKVRLGNISPTGTDTYNFTELAKQPKIIRDQELCSRDYRQQHNVYSEKDYYQLGKTVWTKIFQNNTPVKGWIFDEGDKKDDKITQIFTKDEVVKLIEDAKLREKGISVSVSELKEKEREQITKNLGLDDIKGKKMSEDEIRLRNKENQEFHKKISILSDYPHLLRLTGWIFDFQIEEFIPTDFNIIKLDLSGFSEFVRNQSSSNSSLWANFSNEIDFKTPWTYVDKTTFSIRYLDKLKKEYFQIENGFIKAFGDAYDIVACQFDHNQLKAKLSNPDETEKKKIREVIDNRSSDLTSTGIGIKVVMKRDANGKLISERSPLIVGIEANPDNLNSSITIKQGEKTIKNDSANIDDYIIFGHNLDTGYRVDVCDGRKDSNGNDIYKSLCWRNADYKIDTSPYSDKRAFIDLLNNFKDEPWISESAQAGKSGTLYVDEELCRWNNWSLTCPHIGNYPQDETIVKENHEFNDLELKNIKPTEKTLTPLRFSRRYKFRIRVVDICGNSPTTEDFDKLIEKEKDLYIIKFTDNTYLNNPAPKYKDLPEVEYLRLETVNPPELHFAENVFEGRLKKNGEFVERKLKEEFYGEDLNTFVVRTKIKGNNIIVPKNSVRSVCPPRVTQSFVELHGAIDDLLKDPKERKSVYEKASYENTKTEVEVFKPKEEIPFLTDPIVNSFKVEVEGLFTSKIGGIWNQSKKPYIERKFSSITLECIKPLETFTEKVKTDQEGYVVQLKAGTILKGTIESYIPDKSSFHSDSLLSDDNGNIVADKYSQPKELLFINAVQKPIILNDNGITEFKPIYDLSGTLRGRTPSTPISLAFESLIYSDGKFPLSTTGEIKVIAEYEEIICDKTNKRGFRIEKRKLVKVFSNYDEGISLKTDLINNHDPLNADYDKDRLLKVPDFKALEHSFGDTKYRSVEYSIELVSRFKDYFPNENEFSVLGIFNKPIKIENSKKLESLVIDSIVPVFSWEENAYEVVRKHDTFRIYLEGDWYLNGASIIKDSNGEFEKFEEVEKLAVFFLENDDTIPDEYEGFVSEFGKDPTTKGSRTNGIPSNFFLTEVISIKTTEGDFMNIKVKKDGNSDGEDFTALYENNIKAAVYDITYDFDRKKFFCDIKFKFPENEKLYFPFLKLAVARYLQTSIKAEKEYDFRFSNIITAPQVQIFPVRKIDKKNGFSISQSTKKGNDIVDDLFSKKLEFYLVMERNIEDEFCKSVVDGSTMRSYRSVILNKIGGSLRNLNDDEIKELIKGFKPSKMYIEEFEVYNVWDRDQTKDFKMSEENYNPRNDIRKRLVFTYQIK